jgi:hypothetical protein
VRRPEVLQGLLQSAASGEVPPRLQRHALEGVLLPVPLQNVGAPPGDEIYLQGIVDFIRWLKSRGMRIGSVTYDQFQSAHSIQNLTLAGFKADLHGVKLEDYEAFRGLVRDGLCNYYHYEPLLEEMKLIERDPDELRRPNHPPGGSDDVIDAAASVASQVCFPNKERMKALKKRIGPPANILAPHILAVGNDIFI